MIVTVASGKGGTGKTTIAVNLALAVAGPSGTGQSNGPVTLLDCDVEEPNAHLYLQALLEERREVGVLTPVIDETRCTHCGRYAEVCAFHALAVLASQVLVFAELCHGCGNCTLNCPEGAIREELRPTGVVEEGCAACTYQCPLDAISLEEEFSGWWFLSDTRFGPLVHAHLFAAQENSGKLVTLVKQQARDLGLAQGREYMLVDGPPGIGCPVIATCAGADLALLVTEPTVAAVHDLKRVLATTDHFGVPALVCISKADVNDARATEIERFCESQGVVVVGHIPFDTTVTKAMVGGKAITEFADGRVSREVRRIWEGLKAIISSRSEY